MSKLATAIGAIDARLDGMQDAIKAVLAAVDNVAPWDATLAAIDALRPFVDSPLSDRPLNIIPPKLVIDPAPGGLRIVPPAACHLCNPSEVCGLCKASMDAPRPTRDSERAMKRLAEAAVAWTGATPSETAAYDYRKRFACDVCGNVPDEDGMIEHGRGCYTQSSDGGGQSFVDLPRPQMSEACAVDAAAFAHPPADPTDAYTMDGSQVCAFCNRPSYGSRLCCGCAAEQSGLG